MFLANSKKNQQSEYYAALRTFEIEKESLYRNELKITNFVGQIMKNTNYNQSRFAAEEIVKGGIYKTLVYKLFTLKTPVMQSVLIIFGICKQRKLKVQKEIWNSPKARVMRGIWK